MVKPNWMIADVKFIVESSGLTHGDKFCESPPEFLEPRPKNNFLSLHSWTFLDGSVYCPQAIAGKS